MIDPYLQALDDITAELVVLQQRGPDFPALHRGQILEQLGILAGKLEELRRRRQAPARDPGPVPSAPSVPGGCKRCEGTGKRLIPSVTNKAENRGTVFVPAPCGLCGGTGDPIAQDRAEWDAAPRW